MDIVDTILRITIISQNTHDADTINQSENAEHNIGWLTYTNYMVEYSRKVRQISSGLILLLLQYFIQDIRLMRLLLYCSASQIREPSLIAGIRGLLSIVAPRRDSSRRTIHRNGDRLHHPVILLILGMMCPATKYIYCMSISKTVRFSVGLIDKYLLGLP